VGTIAADQRSNLLVSNLDLFATLVDYLSLEHEQDATFKNPSRSMVGVLRGDALSDWGEDEVYSEQEETRVLRTPQWAYFRRFSGNDQHDFSDSLYDVERDPQETTNLIEDPEYGQVAAELASRIDRFFTAHVRPESDLWHGGRPLQNSMRQTYWREV